MARQRVMFKVSVDLDQIPGSFHTRDDARNKVQQILNDRILHYNPQVKLK